MEIDCLFVMKWENSAWRSYHRNHRNHFMQSKNRLHGDGVVITHVSNLALEKFFHIIKFKTYRTNVGDKYVSEEMRRRKNFEEKLQAI